MLTAMLLCAVFASFVVPPEWRASEMKNLPDRATIRITREYKPGEKIVVPEGCWVTDEKTGLVIEWPKPAPSKGTQFPGGGGWFVPNFPTLKEDSN